MFASVLALAMVAWACAEPPAAAPADQGAVGAVDAVNDILIDCLESVGGGHDMADMSAEEHAAMGDAEADHDDSDGHHDDEPSADEHGMTEEEHAAMGAADAADDHDDSDGHHDDDAMGDEDMADMSAEEHAEMGAAEAADDHDDSDGHHDEASADDPCAGVVASLAKGDVDRVIEVDLVGLDFKPDLMVIKPGETVRFVVTNSWVQEHEFRLTNADDAEAHITGGHQHAHEVIKGFHMEGTDLLALIQPGETQTLDITFDGSLPWSIVGCMIPGHYEDGMWADLYYTETLL
jgi:uncharacterized cupredoxin-like copper-binding protein